jgi:hypothetical protein
MLSTGQDFQPIPVKKGAAPIMNRRIFSVAVWSLFAVACACPAVDLGKGVVGGIVWGYVALVMGYLIPVPWSANFFLLAGWICFLYRWTRAAIVLGFIAIGCGLTMFLIVPEGLRVGYYVWQTSFVVFTAGVCADAWMNRKEWQAIVQDRLLVGKS